MALADVGLGSVGFTVAVIDSQEAADRRRFIGSPTFCVDGEDVFPEPGRPAAAACRCIRAFGLVCPSCAICGRR